MQTLFRTLLCGLVWASLLPAVGRSHRLSGTIRLESHEKAPVDTLGTAEVTTLRRRSEVRTASPLQRFTAADLALRGVTSMGDAFRRMAGVSVRDYGGAGGLLTVSVRGLGAAHTTVLLDGLPVSDARQGQTDLQRFNADDLSALELRNLDADSLLVPARSLGAAVVCLESNANDSLPLHRSSGKVRLTQGSFGQYGLAGRMESKPGSRTTLGTAVDYLRADNDYPFYVENGIASTTLRRTNSQMQKATAGVHLRHRLNDGELRAQASFYHNYRLLPGQVILYVNENDERLLEQHLFGQIAYRQRLRHGFEVFAAGKLGGQRSHYRDYRLQYPGGVLRQNYDQAEAYLTAGLSARLLTGLTAAYAVDGVGTRMKSNQPADSLVRRRQLLQSLSLRLHLPHPRLQLTARLLLHGSEDCRTAATSSGAAGGRRETERSSDWQWTPSLTASWNALSQPRTALYLRGGYKESYRLPSFSEAYFTHYGASTLRPELARQANLGLTLQAAHLPSIPLLTLTVDGYYNRVSDRLISIPYNLFIWRTVNLGRVDIGGLDVGLESHFRLTSRHELQFASSYSFQHAADRTTPQSATYGRQLAYTPLHSGSSSLTWLNPWLQLTAALTYSSTRWSSLEHLDGTHLPHYCEASFSAARSFRLRKSGTQFTLRGDLINAFNERYEIIRRYPMPGRAYRLSLIIEQ